MMLRWTLAARLALIVIIGFSVVAILVISVLYMTSIRETEARVSIEWNGMPCGLKYPFLGSLIFWYWVRKRWSSRAT